MTSSRRSPELGRSARPARSRESLQPAHPAPGRIAASHFPFNAHMPLQHHRSRHTHLAPTGACPCASPRTHDHRQRRGRPPAPRATIRQRVDDRLPDPHRLIAQRLFANLPSAVRRLPSPRVCARPRASRHIQLANPTEPERRRHVVGPRREHNRASRRRIYEQIRHAHSRARIHVQSEPRVRSVSGNGAGPKRVVLALAHRKSVGGLAAALRR